MGDLISAGMNSFSLNEAVTIAEQVLSNYNLVTDNNGNITNAIYHNSAELLSRRPTDLNELNTRYRDVLGRLENLYNIFYNANGQFIAPQQFLGYAT